jgi:hypothetical protein
MQCDRHPYRMAVAECMGCHKGLCDECRKLYLGKSICNECLIDLKKKDVPYNVDDEVSTVGNEFSKLHEDLNDFVKEKKIDKEMSKVKNGATGLLDGIQSKFKEFKLGSKDYGYLVCEDCSGYYKLEEGENPEDFESCRCGGTLKFTKKLDKI